MSIILEFSVICVSINSPRFDCHLICIRDLGINRVKQHSLDRVKGSVSVGSSLTYLLAYLRVFNVFSHDAIPGEIVAIYFNHKYF